MIFTLTILFSVMGGGDLVRSWCLSAFLLACLAFEAFCWWGLFHFLCGNLGSLHNFVRVAYDGFLCCADILTFDFHFILFLDIVFVVRNSK